MSDPFFGTDLFSEFDRLQRQMANLLVSFPSSIRSVRMGVFPPINIGTTDDAIEIVAFAPGIKPEKLDVSIDKGLLTISDEREAAQSEADREAQPYAQERFVGTFRRIVEPAAKAFLDLCSEFAQQRKSPLAISAR
jgi:HSP20 family protein